MALELQPGMLLPPVLHMAVLLLEVLQQMLLFASFACSSSGMMSASVSANLRIGAMMYCCSLRGLSSGRIALF